MKAGAFVRQTKRLSTTHGAAQAGLRPPRDLSHGRLEPLPFSALACPDGRLRGEGGAPKEVGVLRRPVGGPLRRALVGVLLLGCLEAFAAPLPPPEEERPSTPAAPEVKPPPPRLPEQRERSVRLMVRPRRERAYAVSLAATVLGIAGNREVFSLDASLSASLRLSPDWVWTSEARAFYDRRFGNLTADVLEGAQRLDWFQTDRTSVFLELSASHSPFLGISFQGFATVGATHALLYRLDEDGQLLEGFGVELGVAGFLDRYELSPRAPPGTVLSLTGRSGVGPSASLWYEHGLGGPAAVGAEIEVMADLVELANLRVTTSAYVGARLVGPLTLSVFATYAFDGQTPAAIEAHDFYVVTQIALQLERIDPLPSK